jgi:hypothetical protein
MERMKSAGLTIGPYASTPSWEGERFDVAWAIDVLREQNVGGSG